MVGRPGGAEVLPGKGLDHLHALAKNPTRFTTAAAYRTPPMPGSCFLRCTTLRPTKTQMYDPDVCVTNGVLLFAFGVVKF